MQDQIKKAMTVQDRERWAFVARRSKNYTQAQPSTNALHQAEAVLEDVVDELWELLGLPETPIKSEKARGGAR